MRSLEHTLTERSSLRFRSGPPVTFGATTDIGYALTALWAPPAFKPFLRWWAKRRYLALAPQYDAYVAKYAATYGVVLATALDRVSLAPRRILDVSTGTGYAAEAVARRFPSAKVAACDLSLAMVQQAQRRLRPGTVVCADGGSLPFADGAFDLVVLQNAPPALPELARLVAPGGALLLAFSTGASFPRWIRSRLDRLLRDVGFGTRLWERVGTGIFIIAHRDRSEGA